MKILYKQSRSTEREAFLSGIGVENCYLKEIPEVNDGRFVTKKEHSHAGYEIHIVVTGEQSYEIGEKIYTVQGGGFLLIPPGVRHRIVSSREGTFKYSLSFSMKESAETPFLLSGNTPVAVSGAEDALDVCTRISREYRLSKSTTARLIEAAAFELAVMLFRLAGFEESGEPCEENDGNAVLELAKKYINDNAEQNLSVPDVAAYCYMGEKQLMRIFRKHEGVSPGMYIRRARTRLIESLLSDTALSIKEISRRMNFDNEYYFNAFFKKNYGMPPGEYRKTLSQI